MKEDLREIGDDDLRYALEYNPDGGFRPVDVMGILDNTAECFLVSNPATLRLLHELNKQFAMEPEDRTHEDINRLRFLANQLVATSECDLTPDQ